MVGLAAIAVVSTSAYAFGAENVPRASMAPNTPKANNRASPKDVPIIVFIYLFLLTWVGYGDCAPFSFAFWTSLGSGVWDTETTWLVWTRGKKCCAGELGDHRGVELRRNQTNNGQLHG
mgnify:CR=1 FL=1